VRLQPYGSTEVCGGKSGRDCIDEVKAVVGVKQLPSYTGDRTSPNRGVIALQNINKGDKIGEYVGRFIPLGQDERFKEMHYGMNFEGPPFLMRRGRASNKGDYVRDKDKLLMKIGSTSTIIAGLDGNRTAVSTTGKRTTRKPSLGL